MLLPCGAAAHVIRLWLKSRKAKIVTHSYLTFLSNIRIRVVPLSLSPSCVTRKKFARKKWPREILVARNARKEGLPPKPKSLPFHGRVIFRCRISHLDVLLLSPVVNNPREMNKIVILYSSSSQAKTYAVRSISSFSVRSATLSKEFQKEDDE